MLEKEIKLNDKIETRTSSINSIDEEIQKLFKENEDDMSSEKTKEIVKFEGQFLACVYPRNGATLLGTDEDHSFGITKWSLDRIVEGSVSPDKFGVVTITGSFYETPMSDRVYTLVCSKEYNVKYGEQYSLIYMNSVVDLSDISNLDRFLELIVTPRQIKSLYEAFENPLEVIAAHDVKTLCKAKGIGESYANLIIAKYDANKDDSDLFIELQGYGITPTMMHKLQMTYGSNDRVKEVIKTNPYQLMYDVDGVGFITADTIALNGGLSPKSIQRIEAYIFFVLTDNFEKGYSYMYAIELNRCIMDHFGGKSEIFEEYFDENGEVIGNNIKTAIENLKNQELIVVEDNGEKGRRRVYLKKAYAIEQAIANHLKRLLNGNDNGEDSPVDTPPWDEEVTTKETTTDANQSQLIDIREKIAEAEEAQGFEFSDEQKIAIKMGYENNVCMIAGGAGVGKSCAVAGLVKALEGKSIAQTCLAGKAAARLTEVTGLKSYTIHKLLKWNPSTSEFLYNEDNPLPYDVIILDEISMIGGEIFLSLLKAIKTGSKLLMLGDQGQLEAIGSLNIAADIFNSNVVPHIELVQIHRQSKDACITTVAHDVRYNMQVIADGSYGIIPFGKDMIIDAVEYQGDVRERALEWFKKAYESKIAYHDPMEIQAISPVKERGQSCVFNLNIDIQDFLLRDRLGISGKEYDDPYKYDDEFFEKKYASLPRIKIKTGSNTCFLYEKDKVMCVKNNYHMTTKDGNEVSIFNGWTGTIENIDTVLGTVEIFFPLLKSEIEEEGDGREPSVDGMTVIFESQIISDYIVLGYASTAHKMQGSAAKIIIGVMDYSTPPTMLTSQLLYTMITRAKSKCVIVGQCGAIRQATATDYVSTKRTFLQEFLQ